MSNDASVRQNRLTARPSATGEICKSVAMTKSISHTQGNHFACTSGSPSIRAPEMGPLASLGHHRSRVQTLSSYRYLSSADETRPLPYNLLLMDRVIAFGIRMKAIREDRGYSQESLADLAHLHRTYIGGIERGERNLSLINIWRIADALEVPPSSLFADARDAISPTGLPAAKRGAGRER
jgi:DNA-binding XRE family transcriptional regulator